MPWQPGYPVARILSSLKYFAPVNLGLQMQKRHPRSQHANDDPDVIAALGAMAISPEWPRKRNQFYKSKPWRILRGQTCERAGGRCTRCGTACALTGHAHHEKPLRSNWDRRLDPANVRWLCPPCHRLHHHIGR